MISMAAKARIDDAGDTFPASYDKSTSDCKHDIGSNDYNTGIFIGPCLCLKIVGFI